jgi:acetyl esterase/lipase
VILYLPRGPSLITAGATGEGIQEPLDALPSLALTANATVAHLNYRFNREQDRWPAPLHDVLAGYDWVLRHLARNDAGHNAIGVCGELIGGTLAAALALTEGRRLLNDSAHVSAAVIGNPIVDWTGMYRVSRPSTLAPAADETKAKKKPRARKKSAVPSWEANAFSEQLSSDALLRARNQLFSSPQHCFDPFASPLLFFRTPSVEVPGSSRRPDPMEELFAEIDGRAAPSTLSSAMKRRRGHRRHPPADSDMLLPFTRLWVGEDSILKDQAIDLARGIDRNVERRLDDVTERIDVKFMPGLGLWRNEDITNIGRWFGHMLWHHNSRASESC